MLEEIEEGFTPSEEMIEHPEEREEGPTLTEVSDRRVSIEEAAIVSQEEKPQEQEQEREQQEPKISKRKQKGKRTISYLSNISRQIEKNGNQINKITMMVQLVQKQKQRQIKLTKGTEVSQFPLQLIKQIQAQVSQLQKQVTRIQNDIQRIRTVSNPKNRASTKSKPKSTVKPRSKKSKSLKNMRIRRGGR